MTTTVDITPKNQCRLAEHFQSKSRSTYRSKAGGETWSCAWAPDNSYLAWSCGQRILHLVPWDSQRHQRYFDADTKDMRGRKYHKIDTGDLVWSLAFGSGISQKEVFARVYRHFCFDRSLILATGLQSGKIKLWNCLDGSLIMELLDHRDTVRSLDFTKDGSLQLVSSSRDGTLKFWDLNNDGNMYLTKKLNGHTGIGCKYSPNSAWVVAVGSKGMVFLYDVDNNEVHKLNEHHNDVVTCDFSPDSSLLATGSYDTRIIIWDIYSKQKLIELAHLLPKPRLIFAGGANDHYVRGIHFSREGTTLASVCDDGFLRLWKLDNGDEPLSVTPVSDALCCQFSTDGAVLAVGCRNGDLMLYISPVRVSSLMQLCRGVIRKALGSNSTSLLPVPNQIIQFLKYRDFYHDNSQK